MGLDMYLDARKWLREARSETAALKRLLIKSAGILPGAPKYLIVEAMYWRKANAIHAWFVQNVQDGEDRNGEESEVTREQLHELRLLCQTVLADPSKGPELLPTQSGFFFGGTAYDEGYVADCRHTAEELTRLLDDPQYNEWDFVYHSSW